MSVSLSCDVRRARGPTGVGDPTQLVVSYTPTDAGPYLVSARLKETPPVDNTEGDPAADESFDREPSPLGTGGEFPLGTRGGSPSGIRAGFLLGTRGGSPLGIRAGALLNTKGGSSSAATALAASGAGAANKAKPKPVQYIHISRSPYRIEVTPGPTLACACVAVWDSKTLLRWATHI